MCWDRPLFTDLFTLNIFFFTWQTELDETRRPEPSHEASVSPSADAGESAQRGDCGTEAGGSEGRGHSAGGVEEDSNAEPGTHARRGRPEKSGAGRGHKKGEIRNLVCDLPAELKRDLETSIGNAGGAGSSRTDAERDEEVCCVIFDCCSI